MRKAFCQRETLTAAAAGLSVGALGWICRAFIKETCLFALIGDMVYLAAVARERQGNLSEWEDEGPFWGSGPSPVREEQRRETE
jgi:hypothetical protein